MMGDAKHTPLVAGYGDGSGPEYIIAGVSDEQKAVLALRWGCTCCQDTSELTTDEIAFRDKVITACNSHDDLLAACKAAEVAIANWEAGKGNKDDLAGALEDVRWILLAPAIMQAEASQSEDTKTQVHALSQSPVQCASVGCASWLEPDDDTICRGCATGASQ